MKNDNSKSGPIDVALDLPTLEHTVRLGGRLGALALPGDIITLAGPLGAGKTALAQAIGRGVGVSESYYITSPTFSLLHEYPGRIPYYHMDLYRLAGEEEIEDLGFDEYLYGEGLTVIEWPERLGGLMPDDRLHIELLFTGPESRTVRLFCHGGAWKKRLAEAGVMV